MVRVFAEVMMVWTSSSRTVTATLWVGRPALVATMLALLLTRSASWVVATVTNCEVFQLPGVKVMVAGDTVTTEVLSLAKATVMLLLGCDDSATFSWVVLPSFMVSAA